VSTVMLTLPLLLMAVVSGLYLAIWTATGRERPGGHLGPGPWGSQEDWPPFVVPPAVPWAVVVAMVAYAIVVVQRGGARSASSRDFLFWYALGSTQLYMYGGFFHETPAWSTTPRVGAGVVLVTGIVAAVALRIARRPSVRPAEQEQEP